MATAESWVARLAPEPFREFLPYASPSALHVIHAKRVLTETVQVARHYHDEAARTAHARRLSEWLGRSPENAGLVILDKPPARLDPSELDENTRTRLGDHVLSLYFELLLWDGPLFLDLRLRHFAWDPQRQELAFFPSSLWYQPSEDFSRRVKGLYQGFYRNERAELNTGLELYSWESRPSSGFAARMEGLLRQHFRAGEDGAMRFSISHFRDTFDRIFREAKASGAKLHPELTLLGVKLVGLYLTLEALAVPLDPRKAFERVASRSAQLR